MDQNVIWKNFSFFQCLALPIRDHKKNTTFSWNFLIVQILCFFMCHVILILKGISLYRDGPQTSEKNKNKQELWPSSDRDLNRLSSSLFAELAWLHFVTIHKTHHKLLICRQLRSFLSQCLHYLPSENCLSVSRFQGHF